MGTESRRLAGNTESLKPPKDDGNGREGDKIGNKLACIGGKPLRRVKAQA